MKLFDLFGKRIGEDTGEKHKKGRDIKELEIYSGMRVVVENLAGQILFIAKLQDLQKNTAELYQYSDMRILQDIDKGMLQETNAVKIRGYNEGQRKAVLMEGMITQKEKHVWKVEELTVVRIENERSYSRLDVDIDATAVMSGENETEERACKLLNISVGGAAIHSVYRYHKGDRLLLNAKLFESDSPSVLYCEVLRVIEKGVSEFEYGCQFLELTEADQEQIAKNIASLT